MSAQDVSSTTGVPLEYIQKFEGPVLAEREFVVTTALGVSVHTALETDPLSPGSTFGSVIRERLYDVGATNERWASWKESGSGWLVKLAFTVDEIDHDARWNFDPKKLALAPANNEAITLSQQGEAAGSLIPRLRAVGADERDPDSSRFDSGAFDFDDPSSREARSASANADRTRSDSTRTGAARPESARPESARPESARSEAMRQGRGSGSREERPQNNNQTDNLLEALRRRRGERESAAFGDDSGAAGVPSSLHPSVPHASGNGIRIVDVPLDDFNTDGDTDTGRTTAPQPYLPQAQKSGRKGRQAMPTWDEIVFGARSDDDLG
jgi:hypothetical protein